MESNPSPSPNPRSVTVISGRSSFIGRSLVAALLSSSSGGDLTVRIADPHLPPPDYQPGRILYFHTRFEDPSQLRTAIEGSSAVFLVDTTLGAPPPPATADGFLTSYEAVIEGARNVVRVCRECGVERLVYTGSADVVFDGIRDVVDGDESLPYPDKFMDVLNELRSQAEMMVLDANGRDGLSTCVLRASNPFGPGDDHFVPMLVAKAKSAWAKFIIGSGENLCDFTYVENVAHANICTEKVLSSESASVAGKPFFITNRETVKFWDFNSNILEGLGHQRPKIHLPVKLVLLLVALVEADGISVTVESFSQLSNGLPYLSSRDLSKPSKAESLLGSGKVADVLLWRDEKRTFTFLLGMFLLLHWFFLSGRTFISSTAKLLLVVSLILFSQGNLPSSMFGFTIEKMPSSYFEVSELSVRQWLTTLASIWNNGLFILKSVSQGNNWNVFIKVSGSLYLVKLLLPFSLSALAVVGVTCLFSFFIIYEQCEEEVEKLVTIAVSGFKKSKESLSAKFSNFLATYVHKN